MESAVLEHPSITPVVPPAPQYEMPAASPTVYRSSGRGNLEQVANHNIDVVRTTEKVAIGMAAIDGSDVEVKKELYTALRQAQANEAAALRALDFPTPVMTPDEMDHPVRDMDYTFRSQNGYRDSQYMGSPFKPDERL